MSDDTFYKWLGSKERKQELDMIDEDHRRIGKKVKKVIQQKIIGLPIITGETTKIGNQLFDVAVTLILKE